MQKSTAKDLKATCFLENQFARPAALFLVLGVLGMLGWVASAHVESMRGASTKLPFLGLQLVDPELAVARMFSFPPGQTVLVNWVANNSPADRSGVRRGDGITAVNGRSVRSAKDVTTLLEQVKAGDLLKLTVVRAGLIHELVLRGDKP